MNSDKPIVRIFWWQGGLHLEPRGPLAIQALERLEHELAVVLSGIEVVSGLGGEPAGEDASSL